MKAEIVENGIPEDERKTAGVWSGWTLPSDLSCVAGSVWWHPCDWLKI